MIFGHAELVAQYEARIADLKKQIDDLRVLALPNAGASPGAIPRVSLEADAVLTGREESYEPSDMTTEEMEEVRLSISERDRILSGTYGLDS